MDEAQAQPALILTSEVIAITGLSRKVIMNRVARGKFPDPDMPGENGNWHRWHRATITRWLNSHGGRR